MKLMKVEATAEILEESNASDFKHPYLTYARFVFADDKPNGNKQGIKYEEFANLKLSALNMPIKLRLLGNAAGGHPSSVPIGHIRTITENKLEDGTNQLIADAVLYAEEFPKEVAFLKDAHAAGKAPGISWELKYENSLLENGINWLKGVIATAATFVGNPAYGTRTALLALASSQISDVDLSAELSALASDLSTDIVNKGGNRMDEKEKKELTDKILALETQLAEAKASKTKVDGELVTAKAEVTAKDEIIATYAKKDLVDTRTKKFAEAGLTITVDDAKKEFLATLSEDVFTQYLADLSVAAKASKPASATASQRGTEVPRLGAAASDGPVSFDSLKSRMRAAGRTTASATTE